MSFSLFVFACALDILAYFCKKADLSISVSGAQDFKASQLKSFTLNSFAVLFFLIIIIMKLKSKFASPNEIDILLYIKFASIAAISFFISAALLKSLKEYKPYFVKTLVYAFLCLLMISFMLIIKNSGCFVLDLYGAFFFCILILIQTIILIVKTIKK
jgi:hypothetical protein